MSLAKQLIGEPVESAESNVEEAKKTNKWIQKAVNPKHKGYCTPMSKETCTPRRKALAKRFKKGIENESLEPEVESLTAMELIDALAEQEFGLPESAGGSSTSVNTGNVSKGGKKDKGKVVAKAPGKVTYGKK